MAAPAPAITCIFQPVEKKPLRGKKRALHRLFNDISYIPWKNLYIWSCLWLREPRKYNLPFRWFCAQLKTRGSVAETEEQMLENSWQSGTTPQAALDRLLVLGYCSQSLAQSQTALRARQGPTHRTKPSLWHSGSLATGPHQLPEPHAPLPSPSESPACC
jgi:hypothetical protein